jgi:hypothetical protein
VLRRDDWNKIGGIEGALADAAQTVYDGLSAPEREHMRTLLIELFHADGTRSRAVENEVARTAEARAVLERLVERRLVRRQADAEKRVTLEVVHEALARRWPLLHSWLEETRAERELLQDVKYDATRWQRAGKPSEMLWRGGRLEAVLRLGDRVGDAAEFTTAARKAASRQKSTKRATIGTLLALAAVAVVLVLSYLASNQARREAEEARDKNQALFEDAKEAREAALNEKREADQARSAAETARETALAEKREADKARAEATQARDEIAREKEKVDEQRKLAEEARQTAIAERKKTEDALSMVQKERDKAEDARKRALEAKAQAETEAKRARAAEAKYKKIERELRRLRETEGIGEPSFP